MSTTPLKTDPLDPSHMRPATSGSVPVPDPTTLTTAQLIGAIASVRELLTTQLIGQKELLEARLNGMDKAIELLQDISDRIPANTDRRVESLQKLHQEKFDSIKTQFLERDVRTEQTARDSKVAVDAALQAAKEAVGAQQQASDKAISKSELSFTKQFDQLGILIAQSTAALDGKISASSVSLDSKISDMKDRIGRIESTAQGRSEQRNSMRSDSTAWVGIAGVVFGIMVGIAGFFIGK